MDRLPSPIFLITGGPGVGKSATAATLMRRFRFGFHIPVDDLREWVVLGSRTRCRSSPKRPVASSGWREPPLRKWPQCTPMLALPWRSMT